MCLIVFDWQPNSTNWLTLSANRDEFYQRPTAALARWDDHPQVLAGRDLEQGGTWMGITDEGRFAAVTNIRQAGGVKDRRSRGRLVQDFLTSTQTPEQAARALQQEAHAYGLFNLLLGTPESLWYVRNWPESACFEVKPGLHVLSNEHLDSPWPKSQLALQQLQHWLAGAQSDRSETAEMALAELLDSRQRYPDDTLPTTGMPLELEQQLSPQRLNLRDRDYGTRSTTALVGIRTGAGQHRLRMREVQWDTLGQRGEVCAVSV